MSGTDKTEGKRELGTCILGVCEISVEPHTKHGHHCCINWRPISPIPAQQQAEGLDGLTDNQRGGPASNTADAIAQTERERAIEPTREEVERGRDLCEIESWMKTRGRDQVEQLMRLIRQPRLPDMHTIKASLEAGERAESRVTALEEALQRCIPMIYSAGQDKFLAEIRTLLSKESGGQG